MTVEPDGLDAAMRSANERSRHGRGVDPTTGVLLRTGTPSDDGPDEDLEAITDRMFR